LTDIFVVTGSLRAPTTAYFLAIVFPMFGILSDPDSGGTAFLQNVGQHLPEYMMSFLRI
jgi:hypothetical protein